MELLVWSCRILIRQQTQTYKPNISVIYSRHSRDKGKADGKLRDYFRNKWGT
jgi:hypothetical protein